MFPLTSPLNIGLGVMSYFACYVRLKIEDEKLKSKFSG